MDTQSKQQNPIVRQLASLKVLSRLLGHELHAQQSSRSLTLSREEVIEIQTTVDLFIEDISRRQSQAPASSGAPGMPGAPAQPPVSEPRMVAARN